MSGRAWWNVLRTTATEWLNDNPFRLSAALAYYTLFSLAPVLVVAVAIAGFAFGREAVSGQLFDELRGLLGDPSAAALQTAVAAAAVKPSSGIVATAIGIVTLIVGSSAVFGELQDALNTIWDAKRPSDAGIWRVVRKRLLSLAMVAVIGFLLLVSLALSALVNLFGGYVGNIVPMSALLLETANFILSFAVTTMLFASIYKVLPDVEIRWSDVWVGAAATAAMFTLGKSLIGIYLGRSVVSSAYGAAGSVVVLLLWIYYSSLILFFGAEFTHVYACSHGSQAGEAPAAETAVRRMDARARPRAVTTERGRATHSVRGG
jgi:membrane protein